MKTLKLYQAFTWHWNFFNLLRLCLCVLSLPLLLILFGERSSRTNRKNFHMMRERQKEEMHLSAAEWVRGKEIRKTEFPSLMCRVLSLSFFLFWCQSRPSRQGRIWREEGREQGVCCMSFSKSIMNLFIVSDFRPNFGSLRMDTCGSFFCLVHFMKV